MARALSVVDTILGEAGGKTKQERWNDMVSIASAMHNRAKSAGVSLEDVISPKRQFGAFGKKLDPSVEAYRGMAQAAVDFVEKYGPSHRGTYYATPEKTKNLPDQLSSVGRTTAHEYFEDPLGRSFATAQGWKRPEPIAYTPYSAPAPTARPDPNALVADVQNSRRGLGMAALAPDYMGETSKIGSYDKGRLSPSASAMAAGIADRVERGMAPDIGVNSGHRTPSQNKAAGGATSSQHLYGNALDLSVAGLTDREKTAVLDAAIDSGAKGIGIYGSGRSIHVDTRRTPAMWGPNVKDTYAGVSIRDMPAWAQPSLANMIEAGPHLVTPRSALAPTPTARPEFEPQQAIASAYANPATSLANAPQLATAPVEASFAPTAAPTSVSGLDAIESALANAPAQDLGAAYNQMNASLHQAGIKNIAGQPLSLESAPTISAAEPVSIQNTQLAAPSLAPPSIAPIEAPRMAPRAAPISAPKTAMNIAPAAPQLDRSLPGMSRSAGLAPSRSATSVDPLGNTFSFSPAENKTTKTDRYGDTVGSFAGDRTGDFGRGLGGSQSGNQGNGSGFGDGLGGALGGIGSAIGSAFGFDGGNLGNTVAGGLGGFLGSALGSAIGGPIGGLIGGSLGCTAATGTPGFASNIGGGLAGAFGGGGASAKGKTGGSSLGSLHSRSGDKSPATDSGKKNA